MTDSYDPASIEPVWQRYWDDHGTFRAERHPGKPKLYILDMFPYPSGAGLHVGHPEGYTATDIVSRYKRMRGFDVLHPMGWDAFGLPAEQHAIATGTHPRDTTQANIANFKRQLKSLGFSFDWSREIDTTSPEYVRWTQWIFLQLFKRGLAFQEKIAVNWCAALGTVLANEEVIDGRSERGNHPVERLPLRQWLLRITEYADRLDEDLAALDWPETKAKQHNWIGRSEGALADFTVEGKSAKITVFTTRVDTLSAATYVVLAPEHPLVAELVSAEQRDAVTAYVQAAKKKSDIDRTDLTKKKTGVFLGAYANNPLNDNRLPIWVADYVIGTYGTGAVMAVPAHDERDHEFARTYQLPIIQVVAAKPGSNDVVDVQRAAYVEDGVAYKVRAHLNVPDGTPSEDVRRMVTEWLAANGKGSARVTYRLRDWVFSRQRYWGEPIPIYFPVETSGNPREPGALYTIRYDQPIAVEESELPLRLPELEDFRPGNDPLGPLARIPEWRFFQRDGKWYARETNTMPQWAGSCWYYLRFPDPKNTERIFSQEAYDAWMPVDLYIGGAEHAVLHLLYARFWHKVLYDIGLVKHSEPFTRLVHQGIILGTSYRYYTSKADPTQVHPGGAAIVKDEDTGEIHLGSKTGDILEERWATENDVQVKDGRTVHKTLDVEVTLVAEKMSKARGNVVNPDDIVREHGADALRLYEMFMGPLEHMKPWQTSGIDGVRRFLERTWNVCTGAAAPLSRDPADYALETKRQVHKTIKKVSEDIESLRFNTAISAMMILTKHLGGLPKVPHEAAQQLALLVSPFAPHIGEELWKRLGGSASLANEPWPVFDPELVKDDVVEIGVQVNGKLRGTVELAVDADEATARAAALAAPRVAAQLEGKTLRKLVYVKGKIINLIVG
ncbi:leucine--tRNA ligase [Pendulispora albinea]|uniref:Leucine--tRNA ligase n=1 Tax=Pendulispora albinea TaxID=2741071 RepID=A0ABZ2LIU2_9BACT